VVAGVASECDESEGKGNCSPLAELRDGDAGCHCCGSSGIFKTMLIFAGTFTKKGLSCGLSIVGTGVAGVPRVATSKYSAIQLSEIGCHLQEQFGAGSSSSSWISGTIGRAVTL